MPEIETKRLFIAAFPPAPIVEKIESAVADLAIHIPPGAVRWTKPGDIHLTLNFLGNVDCARIPKLQAALKSACKPRSPLSVRVAGIGCFPKPNRPQIPWAGVTGELQPLQRLKTSIDTAFSPLGFVPENRPFHPHLTIGRATNMNPSALKKIAHALNQLTDQDFGEWQIDRVELMESILSPHGANYTMLETIPLDEKPPQSNFNL